MLNVLDLFSGIGGFSLGLERTGGFKTVAFCEIDKHCHKVLNKHWPEVPIFEDVSKLQWKSNWSRVDVICGGFPCQDISVAGKQKGIKDETRSGLWKHYKRLIREIQPSYVIIENVANLRSNGLVRVLQDLWEVGYDAEWHIISARDIGACHLRERIWIIAYPHGHTVREQPGRSEREIGKSETLLRDDGKNRSSEFSNTDDIRFGKPASTEEEKLKWWTEAAASQRDWWKTEPSICRVVDGLSSRPHENHRKQRIKQLGNSIVPGIAEILGHAILQYEEKWNLL